MCVSIAGGGGFALGLGILGSHYRREGKEMVTLFSHSHTQILQSVRWNCQNYSQACDNNIKGPHNQVRRQSVYLHIDILQNIRPIIYQ